MTSECHLRIRHLQEQQIKNQGIAYLQNKINQIYGQIGVGERNEPQLPKAAVLGYMGNAGAQFPGFKLQTKDTK